MFCLGDLLVSVHFHNRLASYNKEQPAIQDMEHRNESKKPKVCNKGFLTSHGPIQSHGKDDT